MSKTSRGLVTIIGALVIAVSFVAPTPAKAADEEGYDLMRQITSQWKHPVVLLVQDVSGSMSWPITTSSRSWYFDYDYDHQGTAYVEPDALYKGRGYGQGYWLKAGDLSSGGGGWQSYSGYVQKNHRKRVYAETNTLSQGTIITISGLGHDADNGTYKVATTPYHSGSYWHFKVYKQRSDGSFESTYHRFYFEKWEWKKAKHWMTISVYTPPSPAEVLWYFVPPSRTAIVKSVLGSTVRTYQPAPSVQPAGTDSEDKPYYLFPAGSGPDATPASGACPPGLANNCGAYYDYPNDQWVGWNDHSYEPVPNPAVTVPSATGHWKDAKGNWDLTGSVIAKSGKDVNFGLIEYSGNATTIRVVPNPDDSDQAANLAAVEQRYSFTTDGGFTPGGWTPTSRALNAAKQALACTWGPCDVNGQTYRDYWAVCGRNYFAVLVTDGQSNECNPDGDGWGNSCSGYTHNWKSFPPGRTDEMFLKRIDSTSDCSSDDKTPTRVQTFAIGLGTEVSRCELNLDAYFGRTDASAAHPADYRNDDRLPHTTSGTTSLSAYHPNTGDYAYFASSAKALVDAFRNILQSGGEGDYATSAPAVAGTGVTAGNMVFLPSTGYPGWKGHFRGYQKAYVNGVLTWQEAWDAGEKLTDHLDAYTGHRRQIYTWDPSNNNQLVKISYPDDATQQQTVVDKLNAICDDGSGTGCGITPAVISFIRGEEWVNGTLEETPGRWRLGALMNSTPAVIGPPRRWTQAPAAGARAWEHHETYRGEYKSRHTLVWIGSSDGMIHGFDPVDGAEIIALLPPDLLPLQVELAHQWSSTPDASPTGEPKLPGDHHYGVANSLRFGDVWDATAQVFRTVLFVTEGPGGSGIDAIDVTHVYPGRTIDGKEYPADPNYSSTAPVKVLWSRTKDGIAGTTATPQLGSKTWSIPSLGISSVDRQGRIDQVVLVGQGSTDDPNQNRAVLVLNPISGDIIDSDTLSNASNALVANQAFADSVLWQTDAPVFAQDNVTNEGIQVDLNGHVWKIRGPQFGSIDTLFDVGGDMPLYYSPAVGAYPSSVNPGFNLFAFASGSFYEKSSKVTGRHSGFVPTIYLGVRETQSGHVHLASIPITNLHLPQEVDADGNPVFDSNGNPVYTTLPNGDTTFSDWAQVIASPMMLIPGNGSDQNPVALYLIFDPFADPCQGMTFVERIDFDVESIVNGQASVTESSYAAGKSAAGGFALTGEKVIVSQSAVGQNAKAHLFTVPNLTIKAGNPGEAVSWWTELQ